MIEPLANDVHIAIATHIETIAPMLCTNFGAIPIMYTTYPDGLDHNPNYHVHLDVHPATIPVIRVPTVSGTHAFAELCVHNLVWLARGRFAVELHSWSPTAADPLRAAFARLTLQPSGNVAPTRVIEAARTLRATLRAQGLDAIALLDGVRGIDLWIPFSDAPHYDALTAWLRSFIDSAVTMHTDLFTTQHLRAKRGNHVYVSMLTNYPGLGTALPYQVRGVSGLPISVPVDWSDLDAIQNGDVHAENFVEWFARHGDLFATLRANIPAQQIPEALASSTVRAEDKRNAAYLQLIGVTAEAPAKPDAKQEQSPVLGAVMQVLADGKSRSADEIYTQASALGLLHGVTRKHMYTDLYEYIARAQGTGHVPEIVQDPLSKAFRLNRPQDVWPDVTVAPLPNFLDAADVERLAQSLIATSRGSDPAAFEIAVCDAFAALGFRATHIGGDAAPDGTLDAPLGVDAYRIILECKTAPQDPVVSNPRADEPDGFRAAYNGTYAIVIGPAFANDAALDSELQTHRVSLWTVDDLCAMLRAQVGPAEILPALAPGRAKISCDLILWERDHGRRKRIMVIAGTILSSGWTAQNALLQITSDANQPLFTYDSLTFVVDTALAESGLPAADPLELQAALDVLLADGRVIRAKNNSNAFIVTRPPSKRTAA